MKVYFVASIKGKTKFLENYKKIIKSLKNQGLNVICEDILDTTEEIVSSLSDERKIKHYKNVLKWINAADIVVTEISYPSINVGHEITLALEKGKPVIALFTGGNEPHLLQGLISEKIIIMNYDTVNLDKVIKGAVEDAKDQMDVRFNFFISSKIGAYLDWIARHRKIPRAVFLRRLIEEHMTKNKDYKAK